MNKCSSYSGGDYFLDVERDRFADCITCALYRDAEDNPDYQPGEAFRDEWQINQYCLDNKFCRRGKSETRGEWFGRFVRQRISKSTAT